MVCFLIQFWDQQIFFLGFNPENLEMIICITIYCLQTLEVKWENWLYSIDCCLSRSESEILFLCLFVSELLLFVFIVLLKLIGTRPIRWDFAHAAIFLYIHEYMLVQCPPPPTPHPPSNSMIQADFKDFVFPHHVDDHTWCKAMPRRDRPWFKTTFFLNLSFMFPHKRTTRQGPSLFITTLTWVWGWS